MSCAIGARSAGAHRGKRGLVTLCLGELEGPQPHAGTTRTQFGPWAVLAAPTSAAAGNRAEKQAELGNFGVL